MKILILIVLMNIILVLLFPACSSRIDTPVTDADSTIIYLPKNDQDITAAITLYRKISKKTGKLIGEGTVFNVEKDEMVNALVELDNHFAYDDRELMFHVHWIDSDGNDLFMKRIDLASGDSATTIKSSISISPEKRQPGDYLVRLYLFRELIAEKKFELLPESLDTIVTKEPVPEKITPGKKSGKKTGKKKKTATD